MCKFVYGFGLNSCYCLSRYNVVAQLFASQGVDNGGMATSFCFIMFDSTCRCTLCFCYFLFELQYYMYITNLIGNQGVKD